jgi:hypothetical protein
VPRPAEEDGSGRAAVDVVAFVEGRWYAVDFAPPTEIEVRLARAREEYREAMAAEHKAKASSRRFSPEPDEARTQIQSAHERVRLAAADEQAFAAFLEFTTRDGSD